MFGHSQVSWGDDSEVPWWQLNITPSLGSLPAKWISMSKSKKMFCFVTERRHERHGNVCFCRVSKEGNWKRLIRKQTENVCKLPPEIFVSEGSVFSQARNVLSLPAKWGLRVEVRWDTEECLNRKLGELPDTFRCQNFAKFPQNRTIVGEMTGIRQVRS